MTKNEFIKIGEQLIAKPKGADYDLIPGKVYDLSWNRWEDSPMFKENGELNLPKKIYSTKTDDIFKKRIITYFNKANTNTTGVILAGTKGTGKTVMAKILAKESGLPIIVVNPDYPEGKLIKFLSPLLLQCVFCLMKLKRTSKLSICQISQMELKRLHRNQ